MHIAAEKVKLEKELAEAETEERKTFEAEIEEIEETAEIVDTEVVVCMVVRGIVVVVVDIAVEPSAFALGTALVVATVVEVVAAVAIAVVAAVAFDTATLHQSAENEAGWPQEKCAEEEETEEYFRKGVVATIRSCCEQETFSQPVLGKIHEAEREIEETEPALEPQWL